MDQDEEMPFMLSEDLVPSPVHKAAGILELDFDGQLSPPLKLHEDLKEGNGGQAWPAGMILAKYLMAHHLKDLEGKSMFVCPQPGCHQHFHVSAC
jgi:protein N-lysine methyltransferase METTL21A